MGLIGKVEAFVGNDGVMRKKGDLPVKDCAHCGRPFAWRRKWAAVWDEVRYCSDRCRREAKALRTR